MKKIAPIVAIALFAVAFTSCKKDYTCTCKDSAGTSTDIWTQKLKKSDAETACKAASTIIYSGGCSLK